MWGWFGLRGEFGRRSIETAIQTFVVAGFCPFRRVERTTQFYLPLTTIKVQSVGVGKVLEEPIPTNGARSSRVLLHNVGRPRRAGLVLGLVGISGLGGFPERLGVIMDLVSDQAILF